MSETIDLKPVYHFLSELAPNNMRTWFEQHRTEYEAAQESFAGLLRYLIERLDFPGGRKPTVKESLFRIHRDMRFSRDKTPYKTHLSAVLAPDGRKSPRLGVYVHLEPWGQSMLAGGLYEPDPEQLKRFRQSISQDPKPLQKILASATFKNHLALMEGNPLKKPPAGFDPENLAMPILRLRYIAAAVKFSDADALSPDFPKRALATANAFRPFLDYLEETVGITPRKP